MALSSSKSFTDGTRGIGGRKLAMDILPEDKMAFRLMLESSQGYGMTGLREWLRNRFGTPPDLLQVMNESQAEKPSIAAHKKAITPQTIPEFVIPTTKKSALQLSLSLGDMKLENNNYMCGPIKNRHSSLKVQNTSSYENLRLCRKISVSPRNEEEQGLCRTSDALNRFLRIDSPNEESGSESGTNDDPKSAAAVSLPHLRTYTSYGFTTLTESPHTRRRESLLFGTATLEQARTLLHNQLKCSAVDDVTSSQKSQRCLEVPLKHTLSLPTTMSPSASSCSLHSDLSGSPIGSPLFTYCTLKQMSGKSYKRRRSSSQTPTKSQSGKSVSSNDLSTTTMQTKDEAQEFAPLGEIKLSLLYNRQDSNLCLSIVKAENLAKKVADKNSLKLFTKVCLLPSKSHRQVSKVIKGTHHPSFNQQFTFKDIRSTCLQSKHLRIRICNQSSTRKFETLGEVVLPLSALGLEQEEEVRMWRDVEPKSTNQLLGSLKLLGKFEPNKDKLTVTVLEANNLAKHVLTGPPDTYATVMVKQDGKPAVKKQTHIIKNSTQPVFKEQLVFTVSPNVETLQYTSVTVTLLSKERIRSDSVIGKVVLGYGSITDNELMHWSQLLNHTGSEIEHCHALQPAGQTRQSI